MSFSSEVKEELSKHISQARHCQIAELASILYFCGTADLDPKGQKRIFIHSENEYVLKKCFTLLKKTYNINTDVFEKMLSKSEEHSVYHFFIDESMKSSEIIDACKMTLEVPAEVNRNSEGVVPGKELSTVVVKNSCCKRAALRGAFLTCGSMSDPKTGYHLEYVCENDTQAGLIRMLLADFEIDGKLVRRKKYHVVYIKEGAAIVDLLNIMEAHVSLMNLENLRILKDISNTVNRRVNCEAANIAKTVSAAGRQVEDINLIASKRGLANLPETLREAAQLRLDNPDASLQELAGLMDPPIGKSGMNHRLRKLSELADDLRTV